MLLHAFKQAKVSEEEVRWSHVYRLLPAEADKNLANYPTSGQL